jgi:hypothetical protein
LIFFFLIDYKLSMKLLFQFLHSFWLNYKEKWSTIALKRKLVFILTLSVFGPTLKAQSVVDATTMNNKVMAGYQGWFRTPGDAGVNNGWAHLFNAQTPSPPKLAFDTWPDMSELTKNEKYKVPGFSYADGSPAYLYSAQNYKTVLRHFQWMKDYGIDGVWLSEFCGHFPGAGGERDSSAVLNIMHNVKKAAAATGRTWAFMWDMSGFKPQMSKNQVYDIIIDQWKKMVDEGITSDARYMHHEGKPVLLIWGFFPSRPASQPDYMNPIIDFLLAPGKYQATLVAGVDNNWRSKGTPEFQAMLMRMQGLQPWSVGRRTKDATTGYAIQNTSEWAGDIEKCNANHVIFIPVFNSGTHIAGPPPVPPATPVVPRRTGNYLWEQFVAASKTGTINSAFIAMFDEINEGTQIMKIDISPPVQAPFLTYDGATSDYYLRLVGAGAKMLKAHTPITPVIPVSPFDAERWYKIKNRTNGNLNDQSKTANSTSESSVEKGTSEQWQFIYDNAGYFIIKNKSGGKVLSTNEANEITTLSGNEISDYAKWHLEWDGSGACRIKNKANGLWLCSAASNTPIKLVNEGNPDDLRWQILPL